MQPKRKEICDCGVLEKASQEPNHPIRWDEKLNEYFIAYGSGGRMMVYYCPFCGGSTPQSRRASLFAHVTHEEETRIFNLFRGIRTVSDVTRRFGPPDENHEIASSIRTPARRGKPEHGETFRGLVYKNLSPVADIIFQVGDSDTVRGTWVQKYVGNKSKTR